MKTYAFQFNDQKFEILSASYSEALSELIFRVGQEADAAKFTFVGEA
jgi:hypothetical protein